MLQRSGHHIDHLAAQSIMCHDSYHLWPDQSSLTDNNLFDRQILFGGFRDGTQRVVVDNFLPHRGVPQAAAEKALFLESLDIFSNFLNLKRCRNRMWSHVPACTCTCFSIVGATTCGLVARTRASNRRSYHSQPRLFSLILVCGDEHRQVITHVSVSFFSTYNWDR